MKAGPGSKPVEEKRESVPPPDSDEGIEELGGFLPAGQVLAAMEEVEPEDEEPEDEEPEDEEPETEAREEALTVEAPTMTPPPEDDREVDPEDDGGSSPPPSSESRWGSIGILAGVVVGVFILAAIGWKLIFPLFESEERPTVEREVITAPRVVLAPEPPASTPLPPPPISSGDTSVAEPADTGLTGTRGTYVRILARDAFPNRCVEAGETGIPGITFLCGRGQRHGHDVCACEAAGIVP